MTHLIFSGLLLFLLIFTSFLFLTGLHQFPLCPPSFIIIFKPGSILCQSPQVQDPLPLLWRHYASWFSPKIPSQVSSESLLNDLPPSSAPTASPIPFQSFAPSLDLLDELSSLLVHLVVVSRGRKQAPISSKF